MTALIGTALAAADVKEVILLAKGAAAFAAAAAAMERRCATTSVGDQLRSFLGSSCFSFSSAWTQNRQESSPELLVIDNQLGNTWVCNSLCPRHDVDIRGSLALQYEAAVLA